MNIIIHSDSLQRSLTINLRGWRTPAALLLLALALTTVTYRTAINLAEHWAESNDPRISHMVERYLARAATERNELWKSTVNRLDQDLTNLQIKLWRITALGNEIADRLGLDDEIQVDIESVPRILPQLEPKKTPNDEVSLLDTRLFEMHLRVERESLRLDQIGSNTSEVSMQRATVPMRQPIEGRFWKTSGFGNRRDPFTGRRAFHSGYDFAAKRGSPVLAGADGIVTHRSRLGNYGKMIEIYHGAGISTLYGHLNDYRIDLGEFVHRGQVIGLVGSTGRSSGPHLHYEVRKDAKAQSYSRLIKQLLVERPLVALAPPEDLLLK